MSSDDLALAMRSTGQFERFVLKSSRDVLVALVDSVTREGMQ
jgi:hypothetical protein